MHPSIFFAPKILTKPASLIILVALVAACSSNKPVHPNTRSKPQETFNTDIQPDGTKQFSYVLEMSRGNTDKFKRGSRHRDRSQKHTGSQRETGAQDWEQRIQAKIESRLDKKIEDSGYCKEGFIILDSYIGRGRATIRGECRDGASAEEMEPLTKAS